MNKDGFCDDCIFFDGENCKGSEHKKDENGVAVCCDYPDAKIIYCENWDFRDESVMPNGDIHQVFSKCDVDKFVITNEIFHRPWGHYEILASGPGYLVKRITVKPGQRTSLQWHEKRQEVWHFVQGEGKTSENDWSHKYKNPHDFTRIDAMDNHRISNTGSEDLVIIEVQTSDQADGCDEADIHRIEDDYGRCGEEK